MTIIDRNQIIVFVGLLAAFGPVATAQESDPSAAPPRARTTQHGDDLRVAPEIAGFQRAPTSIQRRAFGVAWNDGALRGGGADYDVVFDGAGVEYTPALGPDAPRTFPLRLALDAIRRGDRVVAGPEGTPELHGGVVERTLQDGIAERWEVRADGVALSYAFPTRPSGSGDLIVTLGVATALEPATTGDGGVLFRRPELGGVSIGAVTGVDAVGERVRGAVRVAGGHLELSLPAAFVEAARYPLVLDPLIGTSILIGSAGNDDSDPDVAYDATSRVYCCVWERAFSTSDIRIRGQRINLDGTTAGGLITVTAGGAIARNPTIANVNVNDRFLVAWQEGPSVIGPWDIQARALDASSGALSTVAAIASLPANEVDPDAGSEGTTVDDEALLVWNEVGTGIMVAQVQVPVSPGAPVPTGPAVAVTANPNDGRPAVSKCSGSSGRHLVVWERQMATSMAVFMRAVSRDATVLGAEVEVSNYANIDEDTPDVDGDGSSWIVVFEYQESTTITDSDITCQRVVYSSSVGGAIRSGGPVDVEADANDDEREPAIAWVGSKYVVAWSDETRFLDYDIGMKAIDPATCLACGLELFPLGTRTYESTVEIASQLSGATGAGDQALVVFGSADDTPPFLSDVLGQRYEGVGSGGAVTNLGGGCGNGGTFSISGAFALSNSVTLRLTGATGGTSAVLNVAISATSVSCGPCTVLLPDVSTPTLLVSGAGAASFPMRVACEPAALGLSLWGQFLTITPGVEPCLTGVPVSASNRLRFAFGL